MTSSGDIRGRNDPAKRTRPRVNRHALTDTSHKSDALGVLGSVVHPVKGCERLIGTVIRDGRTLGTFRILIDPESDRRQATIDLATFDPRLGRGRASSSGGRCVGGEPVRSFVLHPEGFVVLHVSWGRSGYHVTLEEPGEAKGKTVFDSRRLRDGDLYAVTLLRPGRYEVRAKKGKARGEVRVAYPDRRGRKTERKPPARITLVDGGLEPSEVELDPAQGLVFEVKDDRAAIDVELIEPDDGPQKTDEPRPLDGILGRARRRGTPAA